jgi:hypothetical protein
MIISSAVAFIPGDVFSVYNDSAFSQTIAESGVTLRLAGTSTTGTRTLAQYGICSVLCVGVDTYVITGSGIS